MRAEYFEFKPVCKIWYGLNDLPRASAEDEALWRRIKLVPFTVRIDEDDQDRQLAMKLDREWSGILNWALEGLHKWQQDGLPCVKTLADAAQEYRNAQDPLRDWYEECCEQSPNWSPTAELFQSWKQYCFNSNEDQGNIRSFGKRLAKRKVEFKIRHERKNVGGGFWGIVAVVPNRD
jgi:putative DNA primase/helicase